jgi:arylsulfatase A-like enzyme
VGKIPGRPNILVILTDDHRGGVRKQIMPKTVGWFGDGGRRYVNAVTVSPICGPSRASTMTGLHVHNHTVRTNDDGRSLPQRRTMQRHLKVAGYRTALFGKFINSWRSAAGPLKPDPLFWDEFRFAMGASCMYPQHPCARADEWKRYNVNGRIETVDAYPTVYIAEGFARFVEATRDPWFAYLCPPNPHEPYGIQTHHSGAPVGVWHGNPATEEDTAGEKADKPPYVRAARHTLEQGLEIRERQLRSLKSVDDMIDAAFETLKLAGQLESTLAFLLSDNGMLWSEHTWLKKRVPYEQAIRIPFYIRGPGFARGTTSEKLVANIDVAPTAYRAAGIEEPPMVDGRALQDDFRRGHVLVQYFDEGTAVPEWASIVTPTAKYTEYFGSASPGSQAGFVEYYDLMSDPWELTNGKEPPDGRPFAAQLATDRGSPPPVPDGVIRAQADAQSK